MTERRKWVKGANGLWSSYDPVIARQNAMKRGKARVAAIRERLAALIERDGWKRRRVGWRKAAQ